MVTLFAYYMAIIHPTLSLLMRAAYICFVVLSFAAIWYAPPALADTKPDACLYVEVASLPVKYLGPGLVPTIPGSMLAAHPECKLSPRPPLAAVAP
jgi:hypothetical protein